MGSVVNNRLEAITRGTDLLPGLHAEVHDAIWLLARQWQLGELDGTDAGSPVTAALVTRYAPLTYWQPAGGQARPYPGTGPLEELIESDGAPLPWRDRVAAGLRLARALRRAGVGAARLIQAHPLAVPDAAVDPDADPAAHATSAVTPDEVAAVGAVMAGRVPDPDAVAAAFDANANALVAAAGGEQARAALAAWRTWWADRQPVASGAWQDQADLGYALSATTADATLPIYRAERFGGRTLDWTAFDVASSAGNPLTAAAAKTPSPTPAPVTSHAIPVPVTFHGSPVGRYWQLEDAQTDLGALDTYPTELGKLLLAEFTACFAGDWYRLPVRVPYGSAVRVEALISTDTFGVATLVPAANAAAGARPWKMYEHSNVGGPAPGPGAIADGGWLLVPRSWPAAWTPLLSRRSCSPGILPPTLSGASSTSSPMPLDARYAAARICWPRAGSRPRIPGTACRTRGCGGWPPQSRRTGFRCCRPAAAPTMPTTCSSRARWSVTPVPRTGH